VLLSISLKGGLLSVQIPAGQQRLDQAMAPQTHDEWPERVVCARCSASLGDDYRVNAIGLCFCKACFEGAIREKERERSARIYLQGRCSQCGGSLINGYRLSKLGVLYCISCYDNLPGTRTSETDK
jgi:formylmethanofuran dehydrogenase subunit E